MQSFATPCSKQQNLRKGVVIVGCWYAQFYSLHNLLKDSTLVCCISKGILQPRNKKQTCQLYFTWSSLNPAQQYMPAMSLLAFQDMKMFSFTIIVSKEDVQTVCNTFKHVKHDLQACQKHCQLTSLYKEKLESRLLLYSSNWTRYIDQLICKHSSFFYIQLYRDV